MASAINPEQFEKFDGKAKTGRKRQGCFVTIYPSAPGSQHRRMYISAEALDYLGDPTYIEYHIDHENRRLAVAPTSKASDDAYKVANDNQYAAVELPLRELNVSEVRRSRVKAHKLEDTNWLVIDFLGGADTID